MEHLIDRRTGETSGQLAQFFVDREQAVHALRLLRRQRAQTLIDRVFLGMMVEIGITEVIVQNAPDDAEVGRTAPA